MAGQYRPVTKELYYEKKTEKEEKIFRMIAEEDLKERIKLIMGDMEYHELLNKMDKSNQSLLITHAKLII